MANKDLFKIKSIIELGLFMEAVMLMINLSIADNKTEFLKKL